MSEALFSPRLLSLCNFNDGRGMIDLFDHRAGNLHSAATFCFVRRLETDRNFFSSLFSLQDEDECRKSTTNSQTIARRVHQVITLVVVN